jgi:hypothetical protein
LPRGWAPKAKTKTNKQKKTIPQSSQVNIYNERVCGRNSTNRAQNLERKRRASSVRPGGVCSSGAARPLSSLADLARRVPPPAVALAGAGADDTNGDGAGGVVRVATPRRKSSRRLSVGDVDIFDRGFEVAGEKKTKRETKKKQKKKKKKDVNFWTEKDVNFLTHGTPKICKLSPHPVGT